MSAPAKISGRFATAADTARVLGVSPARRKQLEKLVDGLLSGRKRRSTRASLRSHGAAVLGKKRARVNVSAKNSRNGNGKQQPAAS